MTFALPEYDNAPNLDWAPAKGTQTPLMLYSTLMAMREYEDGLAQEIEPPWKVSVLATNRVLLVSSRGDEFCCYMSDPTAGARLLVDDYVAEMRNTR